MILAKEFSYLNIRKAKKRSAHSGYYYSIFKLGLPLKLTKANVSRYTINDEHGEIGVLLSNPSILDKENNVVLFENKRAKAPSMPNGMILQLEQPSDVLYRKWLLLLEEYVLSLSPSMVMLPFDDSSKLNSPSHCNKFIMELNSVLLHYALTTEVVLYQRNEPLSSLAYIIHNIGFNSKLSLSIDLDSMLSNYYSLRDLEEDLIKYDVVRRVSMVKTNAFNSRNSTFKEFISRLNDDVIVFGDNI